MPGQTIEISLGLTSLVTACPEAVVQVELYPGSDKTVIVNIDSSRYCLLNKIGTRVWQLLQQPTDCASILAVVLAEYRVGEERCRSDVFRVIDKLCTFGAARVLRP